MFLLKNIHINGKTALLFVLKLLLLMCFLKCIFFIYNYNLRNGWDLTVANVWPVVWWSLLFDAFILCIINLPLCLVLLAARFFQSAFWKNAVAITTALLNAFVLLVNIVDIFYFRFHLQRADADLLYVLRNPFSNSTAAAFLVFLLIIAVFIITFVAIYRTIFKMLGRSGVTTGSVWLNILPILFVVIFLLTGAEKMLPTFGLTRVEATQLPLVQNSFHTLLYSVYRRNEVVLPAKNYMPIAEQEALFSIHKKNTVVSSTAKNIVLFIMESVPADFFDRSSPYRAAMPFLDSLVNESTWFNNAFSYSYNSNKGITAILAGIPTVIDIPLYHSNFTGIEKTALGTVLTKAQYESAFFIGDNYDDFGFAKCCNWLGIDRYYCMQDIPGYKQKEKHSLGLHDEYVLDFMQQKLARVKEPFLSVMYNISTHYPNDLPASFKNINPVNKTAPQQSMQYYSECLQQFFKEAMKQPWYNNSVFIFCSDHWAQPFDGNARIHPVNSFRIPLFIFEPGKPGTVITAPASQLDILNTILSYAGFKDSIIGYGENLRDTQDANRTVFSKMNGAIYQAINQQFVLGFNAAQGQSIYCYNYKSDPGLKRNLLLERSSPVIQNLTKEMKAFLQTASSHYRK